MGSTSTASFSFRTTAAHTPKQQQPRPKKSHTNRVCRTCFVFVLNVVLLFCSCSTKILVQASSPRSTTTTTREITNVAEELTRNSESRISSVKKSATMEASKDDNSYEIDNNVDTIKIVFSDVDGTLLHYPSFDHSEKDSNNDSDSNDEDSTPNEILRLPPSSTGLVGIISSQTLQKCQEIRHVHGCKLVLVSGMRTSTLLQRLPFLPKADAYCSEAGGRIFYPTTAPPAAAATAIAQADNDPPVISSSLSFTPIPFSGATPLDLEPFGLVEDMEWKRRMEHLGAAGPDGYDVQSSVLEERHGSLWEFARELQRHGLVVDTKGYSTCFRVNRKHNNNNNGGDTNVFDNVLLAGKIDIPKQLASSTNLGCVDFYPAESGKKNCCEYLALKFLSTNDWANDAGSSSSSTLSSGALLLAKHAVCVCDDDNDLEMALACQHAYIPGISSKSMAETIGKNPTRFTVTTSPPSSSSLTDTNTINSSIPPVHEGTTSATEAALSLILERIQST